MRINSVEHHAIKQCFVEVFQEGEIYLFGSRSDDNRRGGDIDLYVCVKEKINLMSKKITFLVKLKEAIGEQKIDVVFDRGTNRTIDKIARREGILL